MPVASSAVLFERPQGGERAALVHIDLESDGNGADFQEFRELVSSAGVEAVTTVTGARKTPDPKLFVGAGKAAEIRDHAHAHGADVVIFDHELSASQERNLERACECRVLDRKGLILDIFAQRARSFEGKLQVELAQLRHLSTRLIRGWTHLERQKGGIGLRGPGETQLETDRRLLGERIKQIGKRLEKVRRQREQGRRARRKAQVPTVALVGYTNAGKSTLFNRLTSAHSFTADQLFATLDPTLRRAELPGGETLVLADTVGFIRDLPPELVAAFHATLQETREADLLLHVVDAQNPAREAYIEQVDAVLEAIGARDVPQILVYNKIDQLDMSPRLDAEAERARVWLAARSGTGIEVLQQALGAHFRRETVHGWLALPPQAGRARSRLFAMGAVVRERVDASGVSHLELRAPREAYESLSAHEGLPALA